MTPWHSKAAAGSAWLCLVLAIMFMGDDMNEKRLVEEAKKKQVEHSYWLARADKSGFEHGVEYGHAQASYGAVHGIELAAAIGALDCFDVIYSIRREMEKAEFSIMVRAQS